MDHFIQSWGWGDVGRFFFPSYSAQINFHLLSGNTEVARIFLSGSCAQFFFRSTLHVKIFFGIFPTPLPLSNKIVRPKLEKALMFVCGFCMEICLDVVVAEVDLDV